QMCADEVWGFGPADRHVSTSDNTSPAPNHRPSGAQAVPLPAHLEVVLTECAAALRRAPVARLGAADTTRLTRPARGLPGARAPQTVPRWPATVVNLAPVPNRPCRAYPF